MSHPSEPSEPALFRMLLDAAPDATVVVDAQGLIVFANLRTEDVFGYPREELIGKEIELLIPERFRGTHGQHRARFMQAPNVRPMGSGLELHGQKRDGSEFPLEISLSPLATDRGLLVSASVRDISDRRQHEQKLRRIQEHLLSAVESIQGAFAIFDAQERAVLCNSTFQLLVGQPLERPLVGERFDAILDANIRAGVFAPAAIAGGELRAKWIEYHDQPVGALDLRTQDGRILRVVERRTAEGGTVALITDVSDDVTREDELRHARELAEAANSAKSEFLASMSHELRTPLNAVLGFAQLLQRDKKTPLSPRQQERVGHVLKGGAHLLQLIDEVLDLSRIEAGSVTVSLEPVSLKEVIVFEYMSNPYSLLEWTYSVRRLHPTARPDVLLGVDSADTPIYVKTVTCSEAMTVDYHCAWDQADELWMIYLNRIVPAEPLLKRRGSVVIWTNCHHPYYDANPFPQLNRDPKRTWVGDLWPVFYAGHTIELANLRAILEARAHAGVPAGPFIEEER